MPSSGTSRLSRSQVPLWPLPFAIAAVMTIAAHAAWWLSVRDGHVPMCIPYLEGCTSISRAARHGLGNHVFRLLMLPCALLQGLHWWTTRRWLQLHAPGHGAGASLVALGAGAAIALAVYATFLGSEGGIYRFLRRYGVVVYFACTYLAQLAFLRQARRLDLVDATIGGWMLWVCIAMLALGLGSTAASALIVSAEWKDRVENALEWDLGALLVVWFALQGWLWRRSGYGIGFSAGTPPPRDP